MTDEQVARTASVQQEAGSRVLVNRYTLHHELGRGGMGIVWRGEDTVIGRSVAVKELPQQEGAEAVEVFQERVLREVRTGGQLNDPAVVTVYDVVAEAGTTYIVMELVEAPTLSDLVHEHGPLPPHRVASVGTQILSALRAAHEAGIVHRDIKPGNIMVASNGRVKLTDFGIAQAVDDPRLTTSGALVGSPAFMAPERVAGWDAVPASDLWSLGATLFFAVEGIVPFERTTTAATLHAIMNEVPHLTRAQGPLASAIMGLLINQPEARIAAEQVRHLLSLTETQQLAGQVSSASGVAGGPEPTVAASRTAFGDPGTTGRVGPGRRRWLVVGGAVLAVAALVGGVFLGKPLWLSEDDAKLSTLTYGNGGDIGTLSMNSSSDRCLNTPLTQGRPISESNWVDCEDSHDAERYAHLQLTKSSNEVGSAPADYPGRERLEHYAEATCEMDFHTNRVPEHLRSQLQYRALIPTETEWEERPDYGEYAGEVYCFVVDSEDEQINQEVVQSVG